LRSKSLDVYDLHTRAWHKITSGPVRASRIDKDQLYVLRPKGLLETYRIRSGMRTAVQQLGRRNTPVQLEDVGEGFVIYRTNDRIHIRRTPDGKEAVLVLQSAAGTPLHAQIERAGLYYSYNAVGTGAVGRVGFIARSFLRRIFASHG
jgi:hypothetical protein